MQYNRGVNFSTRYTRLMPCRVLCRHCKPRARDFEDSVAGGGGGGGAYMCRVQD